MQPLSFQTEGAINNLPPFSTKNIKTALLASYNHMILNCIRGEVNLRLRITQDGFRPTRTTVAQIMAIRRVMEGVKANNLKAILTFIDFKKAFELIDRVKVIGIMKANGIPRNLL